MLLALLAIAPSPSAAQIDHSELGCSRRLAFDLSKEEVAFEWTSAADPQGTVFAADLEGNCSTGQSGWFPSGPSCPTNGVPFGMTATTQYDQTGTTYPGYAPFSPTSSGMVRIKNVAYDTANGNRPIDVVIKVIPPSLANSYSSQIQMQYNSPVHPWNNNLPSTQFSLTRGWISIGAGLLPAECSSSGSPVSHELPFCDDARGHGAEFTVDFVYGDTFLYTNAEPVSPPLDSYYVVFWDVDGDRINNGLGGQSSHLTDVAGVPVEPQDNGFFPDSIVDEEMYELAGVWNASARVFVNTHALPGATESIVRGRGPPFNHNGNVLTDFSRNPYTEFHHAVEQYASSLFQTKPFTTGFKFLVGGVSAIGRQYRITGYEQPYGLYGHGSSNSITNPEGPFPARQNDRTTVMSLLYPEPFCTCGDPCPAQCTDPETAAAGCARNPNCECPQVCFADSPPPECGASSKCPAVPCPAECNFTAHALADYYVYCRRNPLCGCPPKCEGCDLEAPGTSSCAADCHEFAGCTPAVSCPSLPPMLPPLPPQSPSPAAPPVSPPLSPSPATPPASPPLSPSPATPPPLPPPPPLPTPQRLPFRSAVMSSVFPQDDVNFPGKSFDASRCIDDDLGGTPMSTWSFCMSNLYERDPWFSVRLLGDAHVTSVSIYARSDVGGGWGAARLGAFEVWVGSTEGNPTVAGGMALCNTATAVGPWSGPFNVTCSNSVTGSVVTILLPGQSRLLAIAEVYAYGVMSESSHPLLPPSPEPPSTATPPPPPPLPTPQRVPFRSAVMSSVFPQDDVNFPGKSFDASRCIDDDLGGIPMSTWSFCMSNLYERDPWLSVRLLGDAHVTSVSIYARSDVGGGWGAARLGAFEVWVGSTEGDPTAAGGMALCNTATAVGPWSGPFNVTCSNSVTGSVVTILLPGQSRLLAIAEVYAYGVMSESSHPLLPPPPEPPSTATPPPPPPLPTPQRVPFRSAVMSSVFPQDDVNFPGKSFDASRCIDDDLGGIPMSTWSFCMSNLYERDPWLSVRLLGDAHVTSVSIYARSDIGGGWGAARLGAFEVWVGSTEGNPTAAGGMALCNTATAVGPWSGPFNVTCSNSVTGSVVTILLPGQSRLLAIAEVYAYGVSVVTR